MWKTGLSLISGKAGNHATDVGCFKASDGQTESRSPGAKHTHKKCLLLVDHWNNNTHTANTVLLTFIAGSIHISCPVYEFQR